ncbi:hypothetical protein H6G11_16545 [Cyanobacterium aponinum FACHB-4101]|uniref:Uncharacterized protein n=1 Tax=Cyanobacterium aponinum 0216 TaxID=2676140 RepID=A0A844H2D5_9CHRO|nr:hypothetical protein [Cyanobacterium aponinum]MBD2395855.1 hypothetical protein [Cyanobacterium aponinum FACHB-4101]MTF40316.1 hypothetical protein [Cyanobacterium aponinum 0216]
MNNFNLNRRGFLSGLTMGSLTFLVKDLVFPSQAFADNSTILTTSSFEETYHICVPITKARTGGEETLILRSGDFSQVPIPYHTTDNDFVIIKGVGQNGQDIKVFLHTLFDVGAEIGAQIKAEIEQISFIQEASKPKCQEIYAQLEEGKYIENITNLELLDYIVETSKIDDNFKERYKLASTNCRLLGIENAINSSLEKSKISPVNKKLLLGTFQSVKAGEPITDFKALKELDVIINNSKLPLTTKQTYYLASTTSRALTVNLILVNLIANDKKLTEEQKAQYLNLYQKIRDGKELSEENQGNLKELDTLIQKAKIPENAKVVYLLARKENSDLSETQNDSSNNKQKDFIKNTKKLKNDFDNAKDIYANGAGIVPNATKVLSTMGAETATGVTFSTLTGAAATNATLAFFGGGSVAAGGLGMLGGLAVMTGGAALIGAAGLVSIALASEMDKKDLANLGIAVGSGTLAGAATVLAAWTTAGALGVGGGLSGAAAITATMSALGGLSVITGGAALVASGTAFLIWSFLNKNKKRKKDVLVQLETRIYTPTESPPENSLSAFVTNHIQNQYQSEEGFFAPEIPLDKIANSLKSWLQLEADEQIIALIDSSIYDDAKEGIAFTERRIIWKPSLEKSSNIEYKDLMNSFNQPLSAMLTGENNRVDLSSLLDLVRVLDNSKDEDNFVQFLVELGQKAQTV